MNLKGSISRKLIWFIVFLAIGILCLLAFNVIQIPFFLFQRASDETRELALEVEPANPHGEQQLLILLVDFPDRPGTVTGEAWQFFFFGSGGFSHYFIENSYGQLRYRGDVVGMLDGRPEINHPEANYIRLDHPVSFYADNYYGFGSQFPRNTSGVTFHALQKLDEAGFDFAPYADEEGKIANVIVIFAGQPYDDSKDSNQHLQQSSYALIFSENGPFVSSGGQEINSFASCSELQYYQELIATIGICVHEFGHLLGMFDLYDLTYTTSGIGPFGLMGHGVWGSGNEGRRPFHFSAYSKIKFGWVEPTVMTQSTATVELRPVENYPDIIKLYPYGDTDSQEYFLLENRQPIGFDRDWLNVGLCSGLLIWRIDENIIDDPEVYGINNWSEAEWAPPHPGVMLVEADGEFELINPPYTQSGECEDSWQVGQTWGVDTNPSSQLWNGAESGLSVSVLGEENGVLSLEISIAEK